jgi:peptidoglycan/xylan/chitin deacetylase (PgdA/CDA1 family)
LLFYLNATSTFDESPLKSGGLLSLTARTVLWQHRAMIEFRALTDDHPGLACSPLLRAALLTLRYLREHGAIGLTKTMAFKRVFVHWAAEHFDWPGRSAEEMFRFSKVINEYEFRHSRCCTNF